MTSEAAPQTGKAYRKFGRTCPPAAEFGGLARILERQNGQEIELD